MRSDTLAPARCPLSAHPHADPFRWAVLGAFLLVAGLSQAVWLNFAPILDQVQTHYVVSEGVAGLLILVFPALYVVLSVPAGWLIDRKGYRASLLLAAVLMVVFSALRIPDAGFGVLLVAQIGLAVAQPFAVNAISKLVLDWFDHEQSALATGIGTMGMFIGMAIGMAATPPMVGAWGIQATMAVWTAISAVIAVATFALIRESGTSAPARPEIGVLEGLRPMLGNRALMLVFFEALIGLGYFNGLTTWLEPIVAPNDLDGEQAGIVGGVLILGGIVGAGVVPTLSDLTKRRKPFVLGSIALALATLWPVVFGHTYAIALVGGALQGFFFLPAFALLLEMCSELAGAELAGSATGILMLAGNAGGVLVILAMVQLKNSLGTWTPAVWFLFAILGVAGVAGLALPETWSRKSGTVA